MNPESPITSLVAAFSDALAQAARARVDLRATEQSFDSEAGPRRLDALLEATFPDGETVAFAAEVVRHAYPRDVRRAAEQLIAYRDFLPSPAGVELLVMANQLSPGARDLLRQAGINYFDAGGSLYFEHGTRLIDIQRPAPRKEQMRPHNPFAGTREQVVHALLHRWLQHGPMWLEGEEIAQLAGTSPSTVSTTMKELERNDWVEVTGRGALTRRRLVQPEGLLDAWAAAWTQRRDTRTRWFLPTLGKPSSVADRLLEKLAGKAGWALTGAAAANATVPHLTNIARAEVIVPAGASSTWGTDLGLQKVDQGSNVTFIERAGAPLMFVEAHPDRPGSQFASPFVQYLDLLDGAGRNKELAQEFRAKVLLARQSQR